MGCYTRTDMEGRAQKIFSLLPAVFQKKKKGPHEKPSFGFQIVLPSLDK